MSGFQQHELEPPLDKKEGVYYIPHLMTTVDLVSFVLWCTIGKVNSVARLVDWRVNHDTKDMFFVNNYVSMTRAASAVASNQHTMSCDMTNVHLSVSKPSQAPLHGPNGKQCSKNAIPTETSHSEPLSAAGSMPPPLRPGTQ